MKPGYLLLLLFLFFSLPDPVGPLLLACSIIAPILSLRRYSSVPLADGAQIAAWVYENIAGQRERRSVLERLSGIELAALLESCSQLHQVRHRAPTTLPSDDNASLVVNELRRHRFEELKNGRDKEAVSRFVRAVEFNSPALPPAEIALTETARLVSSEPDLVVRVLREWLLTPDSVERFQAAVDQAPALTERLIHTYQLDLDSPSLSSAEEVSVVLSLMSRELREAYRSELPNLPPVSPTPPDRDLIARKFVARAWSRMCLPHLSSTTN